MSKDARLYACVAALPPWIILFYLSVQNAAYINYGHVLLAAAVFSAVSLGFYLAVARLGKSPGRAALVTVAVWVVSLALLPLYRALMANAFFTKPLRYLVSGLCSLGVLGAVWVFGTRARRREVFVLLVVFETALLALNIVPATYLAVTNKDARFFPAAGGEDFAVNAAAPSPNIYWLFMDGMLGFEGMERLFGDRQDGFAAALAERGFVINRNAEFESLHSTLRATAILMCPHWYDGNFLPLLNSIDLNDYEAKRRKIGMVNPIDARMNNELIRAFRAKGYATDAISISILYAFDDFHATVETMFFDNKVIRGGDITSRRPFSTYIQTRQLNDLLQQALVPCFVIGRFINTGEIINKVYPKRLNAPGISHTRPDKQDVFGSAFTGLYTSEGDDRWYVDALEETFTEPGPRLTFIHDEKAHYPFVLNEDGSSVQRTEKEEQNPVNYPPQHRYAAKVVLGYIDLILAHDSNAVIVVQADHGLHAEENREALLAAGGTEEDVRVMQNSVMSAVRIPEKWGGLDAPLDPLNISRVLVNRYVGDNYTLLETHP